MSNKNPKPPVPDPENPAKRSDVDPEQTVVIKGPVYVEHEDGAGFSVTDDAEGLDVTEALSFDGELAVTENIPSVIDEDVVVLLDDDDEDDVDFVSMGGSDTEGVAAEDIQLLRSSPGYSEAQDVTEMVSADHLPELDDIDDIASMIEENDEIELTAPSVDEFDLAVDDLPESRSSAAGVVWAVAALLLIGVVGFLGYRFAGPESDRTTNGREVAKVNTTKTTDTEKPVVNKVDPPVPPVDPTPNPELESFREWLSEALTASLGEPAAPGDTRSNR